MDVSSKRDAFVARCVSELARSAGFHPVELVFPGLTPYGRLSEHVLARQLPDGHLQMVIPVGCDSTDELATAAERVIDFAEEHPGLTSGIRLRISCVGIGPGGLSRRERQRLLKPVRMQQGHVVVRRFWLALDRRRMEACRSPWGFAPGFEINPCDPDDNVFVSLVRKDRYLTEAAPPAPTELEHRASLAKERSFLSGLAGRRVLVRTLFVVNILVWLGLELTGGSTQPLRLLRAGAKVTGLIEAGQYWRLVTPIFLHMGLLHLVLNALGLLFLGEVLERIYGTMQFALLYLVSGIASVVASFIFGYEMMVGASGAIFGLAGALVVYGYRYRSRIPKWYGAMFGGGLLPLIGFNIAFGLVVRGIDNSAHVGGLIAGGLVTLLLKPLADEVTTPSWTSVRRLATLVVLGVVLGSLVAAGVFFARFQSIYDIDSRWMVSRSVPGDISLLVPGSWMETERSEETVTYRSVCYDGRLEARALDALRDPAAAFTREINRLGRSGFGIVGFSEPMLAALMNDLYSHGRVQVLMQGTHGRQRQQVFILLGKKGQAPSPGEIILVSIGVEISEKNAPRFDPVQHRILVTLPQL